MRKITLAIRFSDHKVSTFQVLNPDDFHALSNILYLMNENLLRSYLKEKKISLENRPSHEPQKSDTSWSLLAPSLDGITFIDFVNKTIHNYNDYSLFTEGFALSVKMALTYVLDYTHGGHNTSIDKLDDVSYDFYEKVKYPYSGKDEYIFESLNPEHPYLFNFYQAFKKHIPVYFIEGNAKEGFHRSYLDVNTPSEMFKQIFELKDATVVGIDVPEWRFFSGTSRQAKKVLLPLLKEEFNFSEVELAIWKTKHTL
ncbi:hypothetical protein [Serratia sp. Se-RSBMAAmG]|uniref:hypothetical protein n=1 Tax=Serratia sp. Se-RSBMAAmG TaxID=3043305 RepID=UPI0024AF5651|nr:hypothetical protein [Serratia sp. Se-RSBMAAmG]MDI6976243.1 hypothetical protein [Serratia sp. Se-RSBMAAmG]